MWGAATAAERGPVIATLRNPRHRNAIGSHAGGYSVYRALAIAAKTLKPDQLADLTDTAPADAHRTVSAMGRTPRRSCRSIRGDIWSARNSATTSRAATTSARRIAITRANIDMPEIREAIAAGRIPVDGHIVARQRQFRVVKAAIDPVWYLPGIAERFGIDEDALRHGLHEQTGGMYPELVDRPDLKVFLPPIGGTDDLLLRRSAEARRPQHAARLPRARRVQRLRRVRLRHLHLPALSGARHRDRHPDGAGGRRRPRGLQPQGRPRARRGHQVPGLQRAQAAEGRRPAGRAISIAPPASPASRTCASRS